MRGFRVSSMHCAGGGCRPIILSAMYEDSIPELDENQVRQFAQLITEFQDVFC